MDVLKNRQFKTYDSISRYSSFPYYYHKEDGKYVFGLTNQLEGDVEFVSHEVRMRDTLDSLSLTYYGRPDYYWIIADFNKIQDPFIKLHENFKIINIPSISAIQFKGVS